MQIYEERLKFVLNKVARNLKLAKIRFEYPNAVETFENYFGVLVPITVINETSDGDMRRQLFVKMSQNQKELRVDGLLEYLYENESFFYMSLLPRYKSLSRIDLTELFAECYYADATKFDEVIVLKDMREVGFRKYQENRFLDFEHVVVSLHSLALLHALSMIFQNDQDNMDTKHLLNGMSLKLQQTYKTYVNNSLNNNVDVFRNTKHAGFFCNLSANIDDIFKNCVRNAKQLVYGHGDFWKENIMYKYEDNKPVNACVLDFQTIRLLSPAQDVLGFLLTGTRSEMRRPYFDFFLETYYDRLSHVLLDHSVDPTVIYSRNDFMCDLRTVSSYCFIIANMSFSLWLGLEKGPILKSKNISNEKTEDNANILLYKQTMLEIADDYVTFGYYNP